MSNYYYFLASLPNLNFKDSEFPSLEYFHAQAKVMLEIEDCQLLARSVLHPLVSDFEIEENLFLKNYFYWDLSLRVALGKIRAQKLNRPSPSSLFTSIDSHTTKLAHEVSGLGLLEAELAIEEGRWQALELSLGASQFTQENIIAYCLKLKILARKAQFTLSAGQKKYAALYEAILKTAPTI